MNRVLDICRYVINYCNDRGYSISNLKLQKLLYFIQAYFLISDDAQPCFKEEIQAWAFGPVVPEAYHEYKIYGYSSIPKINYYYQLNDNWKISRVVYDASVIDSKSKNMINQVIEKFKNQTTTDLVDLTHAQRPWREAYAQGKNTTISNDAIKDYFNE